MIDGNTTAELMHARAEGEPVLNDYTAEEMVCDPDLTRVAGNVGHVNAVLALREMLRKLSDLEKEALNQAEAVNGE
jgi:hypothetical protein